MIEDIVVEPMAESGRSKELILEELALSRLQHEHGKEKDADTVIKDMQIKYGL